ncbi:MAG: conserved hypothetical protein [Candidatus Desulfovibrio kirbyi]|jgi:hypothetical protein|uniref:Uncharacterized protein n=1 Tax=Candidatus Desulfovibrio kirbyi TaxID=2696086 RepID=A0A6L2R6W8_9BACT|nr:serine/threonine protein phosphatase [Desulfovibrio sp.]GFH63269.1 MAG: conserved hypothetical protein [Candidatus Desulfovibrio kirbyi]
MATHSVIDPGRSVIPALPIALPATLCVALCLFLSVAHAAEKTRSSGKQPQPASMTVYEKQPLVTEKELTAFLEILPQFRMWTKDNGEHAGPVVSPKGKPNFLYSQQAAAWVKIRGWEPVRFFCVMGRMAAALEIIEEGNDMRGARPPDMPAVAEKELQLVRRHLGSLLKALNTTGTDPIKR